MKPIHNVMLEYGCRIAEDVGARALLLYADAALELPSCEEGKRSFDLILATKDNHVPDRLAGSSLTLNVPNVNLTRVGQIKIAVTKGIALGLFQKGDKIVCLSGVPKFGYVDSIFVIDVGKEFEILTSEYLTDLTEKVYPEVFGAILNLSIELAAQGREGRKVGTTFVIGDHERVLQLSRQMIINPFMGYSEHERNILNPELKETIKEFSAIDGAFIIREDGTIITAGRHLNAALESKDFPHGLGSRHIAAAGITSISNATAIVLSESTGNVSIFKNGKIFVSIEKPID
ncbi:MAG TPA: diadenylate cyclase [Syntrophales bacterium]|jgi:DNA integrity scanning protein DisA with diadenylate cyclase activity|nr:diadenylate cyclase [Syntrophales bacterium]HON23414.1 diadenylate cyclase [Syntrophales bacterium]HOU76986.1 diadenylate cyclase [Syntrophales bacterium]HPC32266.1 diadenylate cyclase [Syntrophales bacterium]HQG34008.1 diadenylate cyclase [Syntrophales bacterium]